MDNTFLIKHLEVAQAELAQKMARHAENEAEQAQLEHEIARLTLDIAQVHEMVGEIPKDNNAAKLTDDIREWGLTDAVRVVMKAADRPLSAIDVRDRLKTMGFNVKQYQNDMATVNLTLERMARQGEIDGTAKRIGGKRLYIWSPIGPNPEWGDIDEGSAPVKVIKVPPGQLRAILTSQRPSGKETPAWYKHMKEAGLELTNPPFAKQKRSLTVREAKEARQAQEAIEQAEQRKRMREFEAKKKRKS
jgi:hypothetical protein